MTSIQTTVTEITNNSSTGCSPYVPIGLHSVTSINKPHYLELVPKADLNQTKMLKMNVQWYWGTDNFFRIVTYSTSECNRWRKKMCVLRRLCYAHRLLSEFWDLPTLNSKCQKLEQGYGFNSPKNTCSDKLHKLNATQITLDTSFCQMQKIKYQLCQIKLHSYK